MIGHVCGNLRHNLEVLNKKVVRNLFSGTCDQFELSPETPMSTLSRLYENVLRVFTYASIEVTSGSDFVLPCFIYQEIKVFRVMTKY